MLFRSMDPIGRKEILDILSIAKEKTTILFSTHILSDVERICDTIGVLDNGHLVLKGKLEEIKNSYRQDRVLISLADSSQNDLLIQRLSALSGIKGCTKQERDVIVRFTGAEESKQAILRLLLEEGFSLIKFELLEPSLENLFLEVVK